MLGTASAVASQTFHRAGTTECCFDPCAETVRSLWSIRTRLHLLSRQSRSVWSTLGPVEPVIKQSKIKLRSLVDNKMSSSAHKYQAKNAFAIDVRERDSHAIMSCFDHLRHWNLPCCPGPWLTDCVWSLMGLSGRSCPVKWWSCLAIRSLDLTWLKCSSSRR